MRDNKSEGPAIIVGATDVAYGVDWIFANPTAARPRGRIGDYRLGYAEPPPDIRLADAVAASCAFPPFFAPMTFDGNDLRLRGGRFGDEAPGQEAAVRELVRLTDGGVYDNLALEPVWKTHQTVIVSDGGGVFKARSERTLWGRLLQILSIANGGGSSVRLRWLHASFARKVMSGVTWGLDTVALQGYPLDVVELINVVRTDLDAFSQQEQHILERHGYHVADQAVHRYRPELVDIKAPLEPPHSDVADPVVAAQALRRSAMRTVLGRW
jgi:NTE family protein